jgi:hypothetical protein
VEGAGEEVREDESRISRMSAEKKIDTLLVEAVEHGANIVMNDADWKSIPKRPGPP